ncbi:hypothetical protein [Sessilibacter corallicola]|uniref:Uncharacterized protein n=1 Tax=Sessilibacter corallicola TaxID=2904075 RepID=A0ABQ0A9J4_9GAMM
MKNKNMIFDILTFDKNQKLTKAKIHLGQFEKLSKDYLNSLSLHLYQIENQESLLTDIESEINTLRTYLIDKHQMLENRAVVGASISHVCDRIISLLAYSAGYTGSSAAATRIEFANGIIKEYLNDNSKTVAWIIEQVYGYSSSNYLNKNAKALLFNLESLYSFSKLLNDLENTKLNSAKLYREVTRSLNKAESMYASEYKELMLIKHQLSELNGIQEASEKNILKIQSYIGYLEYEIDEARQQADQLTKPNKASQ